MVPLLQHVQKMTGVCLEEPTLLSSFFEVLQPAKKGILMSEGQLCRQHYFVAKGCLRLYYVNDKGIEQTTQFAIENWWLTDYMSFLRQEATEFYIQAVEPSEVYAISYQQQEVLLKQLPEMERYFRLLYQRGYAASQMRARYFLDYSKEERYLKFVSNFPGFVQRVPQYLLASYLGLTPEYLSEIRKRNIS